MFVAHHVHWSLDSIVDLDHLTRHRVIAAVQALTTNTTTAAPGWLD